MSIVVSNLTKKYGDQKAVDAISFSIKKGEIVGFIGPNGAGKSTTMKVITGYIKNFTGEVSVNGHNVIADHHVVKQNTGYLPEHNPLYVEMYVREYLLFIANMYSLKENKQQIIDEIIELTGLAKEQNKRISALSKGYRQRVGIASSLIHNPEVLILDEPTTGLDPNQIVEIRNVIAAVGKDKTVLLSTHIMQEVEAICDRIIIINNGKIVADDETAKIKSDNKTSQNNILVEFSDTITQDLLMSIGGVTEVSNPEGNKWIISSTSGIDVRKDIFNLAVKHNNAVLSSQLVEKSLEDIFRDLTKA